MRLLKVLHKILTMLTYIGKLGVHHHVSLQVTIVCRACLVRPHERLDLNLTVGSVIEYLATANYSAVLTAGSRCAGGWHTGPPPLRPVSLVVWLTLPSGLPMALSAGWAAATMASQYYFAHQSAVVASLAAVYMQCCVTQTYVSKQKNGFLIVCLQTFAVCAQNFMCCSICRVLSICC